MLLIPLGTDGKDEQEAERPRANDGCLGGVRVASEAAKLRLGEAPEDREGGVVHEHWAAVGCARSKCNECPGEAVPSKLVDHHRPARQSAEREEQRGRLRMRKVMEEQGSGDEIEAPLGEGERRCVRLNDSDAL